MTVGCARRFWARSSGVQGLGAVSRGEQATLVGDVKVTWWRFEEPSSSFERSPPTQWIPPDTVVCSVWLGGPCGAPLWLGTTEDDGGRAGKEQEKHRPRRGSGEEELVQSDASPVRQTEECGAGQGRPRATHKLTNYFSS